MLEVMAKFLKNLVTWMEISCKLWIVWWAFGFLQYLPPALADRIIEAVLRKLGI